LKKKNRIENLTELNEIIVSLKKNACQPSKYNLTIVDERILLILLDIVTELQDSKLSQSIYTYLYEKRNYKLYKKNSDRLKKSITKEPFGGTQAALLLLCELNEEDKTKLKSEFTIFFHENFPYHIRIRLGEKNVEDILIQMYDKELQFEKLKDLVNELELAGTKNCEMVLVNSLKEKNEVQHSDMYSYSAVYYIIQALGRLNPENTIPNDDFIDLKKEIERNSFNDDLNANLTKKYLEKLYKFINLRYGIKIERLKNIDFIYSFKEKETPGNDAEIYKLYKQLNGK
jgi:hypothetical protein